MALSDEITVLQDRVMVEMIAAHDYYVDTKNAWRIVRQNIAAGQSIKTWNATTGTRSTQVEFAARSREYVTVQLTESTFQQFLSIFESFVFDFLQLWLTHYPRSLVKRMVDFQTILDLPDKAAITRLVVRKELRDVLYDRPTAWFAYLEDKAKLGCPSADEVERIAEAKASGESENNRILTPGFGYNSERIRSGRSEELASGADDDGYHDTETPASLERRNCGPLRDLAGDPTGGPVPVPG